jgi:hypothetical protein
MPTNRTRQQRGRRAGLQSWLRWCGNEFRGYPVSGEENPWTDQSSREFYDRNKAAILLAIDERNKTNNRPFFRPLEFWQDLETKNPRLEGETETWRPCLAHVSNGRYLSRLGLLEPWEKEVYEAKKDAQ